MNLKYFSKNYFTDEQLSWLRESRKELVYGKVLDFADSQIIESYQFKKPMYIKMRDDSLLDELNELSAGEYEWNEISKNLQSYMYSKDELFYNKAYRKWKKREVMEIMRRDRHVKDVELHYGHELTQEQFEVIYSGQKISVPTPVQKKLRDSTRRTYKTVNDYIKANIDRFEYFATLTFARESNKAAYHGYPFEFVKNPKDFEECKKAFTRFVDKQRRELVKLGIPFYYVAVFEQHKDGSYHFHMMMNDISQWFYVDCPEWLDIDYKTNERRNGVMFEYWKYGKSDIERIKDKDRMASYLCKYLTKSILNLTSIESYYEMLGKRRYFCSQNLLKPKVEYISDLQMVEDFVEDKKNSYADTYEKEYKNPYNDGKIIKTIFSKPILQ